MSDTSEIERPDILYLEDHIPGSVYTFGSVVVDEKTIVDFASQYDPQVFHTDPEAAKKTSFGGIVASGWHTAVLAMRLIVDHRLSHMANLGSPGLDEVRFLKPVRPGDELRVRLTILEARPSASKADRGVVKSLVEVLNQSGEVVASWKGINIVLRKKPIIFM
jgi:acyl dehydratase